MKETHTHESVIAKKKDLLSRFPVSAEEAGQALKNSMGYYEERQGVSKYFPGHDFSKTYAEPEVKEKLMNRLLPETFPRNEFRYDERKETKLLQAINATQEELEQRYRDYIVADIQKQMNSAENLRSRNLPKKLRKLRSLCSDKEKYKQAIDTEEIKALIFKYAKMKICDHEFSDEFYSDKYIEKVCADESFPFTFAEIEPAIMEVF